MVYITRPLLTVLLEQAAESGPSGVSVPLGATDAGEFDADLGADYELDDETPILSHFYMPDAGKSVSWVFGVDLGTPPGSSRARFVSRSEKDPEIFESDDLSSIIVVAVPPWEDDSVTVFDRSGDELPLTIVDAEPPEESLPE